MGARLRPGARPFRKSDKLVSVRTDREPTARRSRLERRALPGHEIIAKSLDRFSCSPSDTTAYLYGHPGMVEAGTEILRGTGFQKGSVRAERFWVAPVTPAAS